MPTTSSKSNRVGRLAGDDDTALDDAAEEARIHDLAKAVVRALTPGNGRKSPCEEDELRKRLEQDGAVYNSSDLPPALSVLENNDGSIPGLPYVLQRPLPDLWQGPSRLHPHLPRLLMIGHLRAY